MRRKMLMLAASSIALLATVAGSAVGMNANNVRQAARPSAASAGTGGGRPTGGDGVPATAAASLGLPAAIPLLNGWRYLADPTNVGLREDWGRGGAAKLGWTPVAIPNDFNPTISDTADGGTVGWYEIQFTGPVSPGRAWDVQFEGVRRHAQVWLNGYQIGTNSNPYAPFKLPATTLEPGAPNLLIVRVDNFRGPGSFPEDWWNWGGITGPVTLKPASRISLENLGVLPELSCHYRCGDLLVEGTLINHAAVALRPQLVVDATSPRGIRLTWRHRMTSIPSDASVPISFRVPIRSRPDLWSPTTPSLYQVRLQTVLGRRVEQAAVLRVGMRSAQVRAGVLYLNGRRLWLRGAAIHEDIAGRGAALTDGDINTIVSELRSVGANVTRAHYLLNERLLDALDAAGIMAWEQPDVDHADQFLRTASGRRQALAMLRGTIIGDRSHASVVVNSVGNELSPTPDATPGTRSYLDQAIGLARQLDPAATVGLDTYAYPGYPPQKLYTKLDVLGIDSYFGWYTGLPGHRTDNIGQLEPFLRRSRARYPKQALVISEFGAEALYDGPATTKGTYEFQSDYLRRTFRVLDRLRFMNGAIYWTLREFAVQPGWTGGADLPPGDPPDGLHHKGLIAYDGTEKPAFEVAQQLFAEPPSYAR